MARVVAIKLLFWALVLCCSSHRKVGDGVATGRDLDGIGCVSQYLAPVVDIKRWETV